MFDFSLSLCYNECMDKPRQYIAIDLKSFYASVECNERGLDPLDANLVVADESRTDKTICLAVSPSLKSMGVPGRPRLFEAKRAVEEVNRARLGAAPGRTFTGQSVFASELAADPGLAVDFIVAQPRMAYYMEYSRSIVEIYLRYVSPEDLLVYSIDEVFIDVTPYLETYKTTAHDFAMKLIREVLKETRITATAGVGTNLYLAKIAMDIVAKKMPADADGVRIADLDEISYREKLWAHRPLTDFWRIGKGIARRLESRGLYTMGDVARCSEGRPDEYYNEDLLYRMFGVNAELLIDHAWGWEPALIADCKAYVPENRSLSSGQVLSRPYEAVKAKLVVMEMADALSLDLVRKGFLTDQIVLDVNYDTENARNETLRETDKQSDFYGRSVPKPAHGSVNLSEFTASTEQIMAAVSDLFDRIVDTRFTVRRLNIGAVHLITEDEVRNEEALPHQMDLFADFGEAAERRAAEEERSRKEKNLQKALLSVRDRYGKNSVVRGMNMLDGATAIERNSQIGGHKA